MMTEDVHRVDRNRRWAGIWVIPVGAIVLSALGGVVGHLFAEEIVVAFIYILKAGDFLALLFLSVIFAMFVVSQFTRRGKSPR